MDFETLLKLFLTGHSGVASLHAETNSEGRPTIWIDGNQFIAVGHTMVPAKPLPQRVITAGFDSHEGMGSRK